MYHSKQAWLAIYKIP